MTITILGTGTSQGVPVIGCGCASCTSQDVKDIRLRSSILVQSKNTSIIIDVGPDFRHQMLTNKVARIDAALITHEHNDHVIGLDDLRPFNFNQQMDIPIFSIKRVIDELKRRFVYAFADVHYPGAPSFIAKQISYYEIFQIGDIKILPLLVKHGNLDILGFRIQNFAYITDASFLPEATKEKLKDLDYLMINSLRKEKHNSHFNLEQTLATIEELAPGQAMISHISHLMGPYEDWSVDLPDHVTSAFDGMIINCRPI